MSTMKKPFVDYQLYIFDLDGTLYDQPNLRKVMAMRLLKYYLSHPVRIMDLYYIYRFRKVKDRWDKYEMKFKRRGYGDYIPSSEIGSLDADVCMMLASGNRKKADRLCGVIYKWIYDNPLTALKSTADSRLIEIIKSLRTAGKKVVIFSDYPVENKLAALEIKVDGQYCATDKAIGEYKPSSKGLEVIMKDFAVSKADVIMIGDREEKDGLCAASFGIDFFILNRSVSKRNYNF